MFRKVARRQRPRRQQTVRSEIDALNDDVWLTLAAPLPQQHQFALATRSSSPLHNSLCSLTAEISNLNKVLMKRLSAGDSPKWLSGSLQESQTRRIWLSLHIPGESLHDHQKANQFTFKWQPGFEPYPSSLLFTNSESLCLSRLFMIFYHPPPCLSIGGLNVWFESV